MAHTHLSMPRVHYARLSVLEAMRSQQEAAEIEADFTDALNLCDPQPNDMAPNDIALTTVSQPKSEVQWAVENWEII